MPSHHACQLLLSLEGQLPYRHTTIYCPTTSHVRPTPKRTCICWLHKSSGCCTHTTHAHISSIEKKSQVLTVMRPRSSTNIVACLWRGKSVRVEWTRQRSYTTATSHLQVVIIIVKLTTTLHSTDDIHHNCKRIHVSSMQFDWHKLFVPLQNYGPFLWLS